MSNLKTCTGKNSCGEEKPESEFYANSKQTHDNICKKCRSTLNSAYACRKLRNTRPLMKVGRKPSTAPQKGEAPVSEAVNELFTHQLVG